MKASTLVRAAALIAGSALLSGCISWFDRPQSMKIRPIAPSAPSQDIQLSRADAYYQSAVRAIERRDYAMALDLLQAARARDPESVRVINAMGVVYDKLGRFDLSTRYYAQAQAIDPNSAVVRSNLAYSQRLQGKAPVTALAAAQPAPAKPAAPAQAAPAPVTLLGAAPAPRPVITIAAAPAPLKIAVAPNGALITGRALQIVDASGATGGAESVRLRLADRGWTAPKALIQPAAPQARTTIVYPHASLAVANALAKTLPFPVQMAACLDSCDRVSLIVGQDAAAQMSRSRS